MCGIAAYFDTGARSTAEVLAGAATRMADQLQHRGPDDAGAWIDEQCGIALSHRRLSVVDISPEGHQPMVSGDGRYVVSFNGEIYNHAALHQQLIERGHAFRGHSDTEVLLAAIVQWGLEGALARFNGMFAFALWDRRDRLLRLARDRLGEKPLYYTWLGRTFAAASELKALRIHASFDRTISRGALSLYLRHGYVPGPLSIYESAFKVPPGTVLEVSARSPGRASSRTYWTIEQAAARGREHRHVGSESEAVEEVHSAMRTAVALRMHADVPLGAFLSGGVDSTAVVALMQAQSARPVRTFSIGFYEARFNEAQAAKAVAAHLGTHHTELYVTPAEALAVIPLLPSLYDEPFADSSQIPTFLVARLARGSVTVSLSGDGGDELFGGYTRYLIGRSLWHRVGWIPPSLRKCASDLLRLVPSAWESLAVRGLATLLPRSAPVRSQPGRLAQLARMLSADDFEAFYRQLVSACQPAEIVLVATEPASHFRRAQVREPPLSPIERMMLWDASSYLPDDILVKVDRASMGVSLEARVPLLDHDLVEIAWRMPESVKVRAGVTKWILRQILERYVPARLIERPKQGFGAPIGDWLRGPLREWARDLLSEDRVRAQGFFNPAAVVRMLATHLSGAASRGGELWAVLMFQAWLEATATRCVPDPARASAPLLRSGVSV